MEEVSVVMPVYNNAPYIGQAIESILQGDDPHFELIIVDDGSRDTSYRIMEDYARKDSRIRLLQHPKNRGTHRAIKTAIAQAKGKYIFIAAADDISMKNRIPCCVEVFEKNKNVGIVVSGGLIIDATASPTGEVYEVDPHITNENIAICQFKRNYCLGATMAIRNDKDILLKEDMFQAMDDYEIALAYLMNHYEIDVLRKPLIQYRIHGQNQSNKRSELVKRARQVMEKYTLEEIALQLRKRGFEEKEIQVTLGIMELFKGKDKSANALLLMAEDLLSKNPLVYFENYFYLGVSFYRCHQWEKSYAYFQKSHELNPMEPTICNNFGVMQFLLKKDEALGKEWIDQSLRRNPNYLDAKQNIDNIHNREKPWKITERILESRIFKRESYILSEEVEDR